MLDKIKALKVGMHINTHVFLLFEALLQYLLEGSMPEEGREEKSISAHFSHHTDRARDLSVIGLSMPTKNGSSLLTWLADQFRVIS
jgi:hypothetical protein